MLQVEYPDLFVATDNEATRQQRAYFRLLFLQYFSLFLASALTLSAAFTTSRSILVIYIAILCIGMFAALLLATQRPHQKWYQMRALAESCKTLAWRYMMGSEPFQDASEGSTPKTILANRLHELATFQNLDASVLVSDLDASEQTTTAMDQVHSLSWEDRHEFYLKNRIDDQLRWYRLKSAQSKRSSHVATWTVVAIYLAAIATAIGQVFYPIVPGAIFWVSEPLIVLGAGFLGYAQAKRHAELSSSYALTALEIQKLRAEFVNVSSEALLSEAVNSAETAFSREHTQWIARVV